MTPAGPAAQDRPRLLRGVRLKPDPVRGDLLLAPERALRPNATAVAVLRLCDGSRSFAAIVDALALSFAADRGRIEAEAAALLAALAAKRMVEW